MNKLTVLGVSLISAGLSSLITAKVVETKMLKEYDDRLERDLAESVTFLVDQGKAETTDEYEEKQNRREAKAPLSVIDEEALNTQRTRYDSVLKKTGYSPDPEAPQDEVVQVCDTNAEIYVITTDEFMENESGFDQSSLTYFADGGVLEEGELVVDFQDLIGNAVPPFGEKSGEPHVVYIRNSRLQREFEVIQDDANAADILAEPGRVT